MSRITHKIPLIALCLGFFMVIMDASVVNVALPSIASALHSDMGGLQWVIAGYAMTFSCFLLLAGHLTDQVGAKAMLILGLSVFLIASIACGLSSSILSLVLSRLAQGAAAATLVPSSLVLIKTSYPDKKEQTKAIGLWGSMGGIAAASGPVFGGFLTAALGWPSIFMINVPIALLAIFLVIRFVTEAKLNNKTQFDITGQILGICIVASFAFLLIDFKHFTSKYIIFSIISLVFIVSITLFIRVEKRKKHPMLPLYFFKSKNFSLSIMAGMIINIGLYGTLFALPLYFQQIRGYNTLMTGFAILPLSLLVALSSYLSGKLASHRGPKLSMYLGFLIGILGFFSLLIIGGDTTHYYYLIVPLAAIGFGVAFTMPAATVVAIHAVPEKRAGIASGAFTTGRQLGSLMGVAVFGSIVASSSQFIAGLHVSLMFAGLLFIVGFLLSCFVDTTSH